MHCHSASTPRYETVTVPISAPALLTAATSLAAHVSQTGGKTPEQILPRVKGRRQVLGRASTPPVGFAEWYIRVVNML